jgi:hypothetical protein
MKKIFILFLLFVFKSLLFSQDSAFPKDWLGIYSGEMYWIKSSSEKADTVFLNFEFLESGKPNCWLYRMTYENQKFGKLVKDYALIKYDSLPANEYLLNEKDGILIQMVKLGNSLYSNFSAAGQYLTSVMRKEDNEIFYEIIASKENYGLMTQNIAENKQDIFQVKSFPPYSSQVARLKKRN